MSFEPGNYANCDLKEAITSTTKNGLPQMILTFAIGDTGATRTVRFMLNNDTKGKDGKTNLERSTESLQGLGFDGNFEDPQFSAANGVTLYMKLGEYNGQPQEEWNIGRKYEKAGGNILANLKSSYRALAGAQPRPASAKPPAPAPTPPARKGPPSTDPLAKVADLQTAWDHANAINKSLTEDAWVGIIADIAKETKRTEAQFTVADWKELATRAGKWIDPASIPF